MCRKNNSLALQGSFTSAGPQIWNEFPVDVRECTNVQIKTKNISIQACL